MRFLLCSNRIPEAAFMARTYLPSQVSRIVALWRNDLKKVLYFLLERSIFTPLVTSGTCHVQTTLKVLSFRSKMIYFTFTSKWEILCLMWITTPFIFLRWLWSFSVHFCTYGQCLIFLSFMRADQSEGCRIFGRSRRISQLVPWLGICFGCWNQA